MVTRDWHNLDLADVYVRAEKDARGMAEKDVCGKVEDDKDVCGQLRQIDIK